MDVVRRPTDTYGRGFVFPSYSPKKSPNPFSHFRTDQGLAILGAENNVVMKGGIGVCHRYSRFTRRYATEICIAFPTPGFERPG
jgi:hypothetical protein